MIRTLIQRRVLACLCGTLLAGCGSRPDVHPVTGTVTFQGEIVPLGMIMFYPQNGGRPAIGEIGADGTYQLRTYDDQMGALAGKHTVTITARQEADGAIGDPAVEEQVSATEGEILGRAVQVTVKWLVPPEYSQRQSSRLSAEVLPQENTIDFDLPVGPNR